MQRAADIGSSLLSDKKYIQTIKTQIIDTK